MRNISYEFTVQILVRFQSLGHSVKVAREFRYLIFSFSGNFHIKLAISDFVNRCRKRFYSFAYKDIQQCRKKSQAQSAGYQTYMIGYDRVGYGVVLQYCK